MTTTEVILMLWIDWLVALSVARLVGYNELGLLSLLVGGA